MKKAILLGVMAQFLGWVFDMGSDNLFHKRKAASAKRNSPKQNAYNKVYLIVCEGETEEIYFCNLKGCEELPIDVDVFHDGSSNPMGMLKAAEAKMKSKNSPNYDAVFLVFDVDIYHDGCDKSLKQQENEVKQKAKKLKITLIRSDPCFEYWVMLHIQNYTAPVVGRSGKKAGDVMGSQLRQPFKDKYKKDYDKGMKGLYALLKPEMQDAISRSKKRLEQAQRDENLNPSTEMHLLLAQVLPQTNKG